MASCTLVGKEAFHSPPRAAVAVARRPAVTVRGANPSKLQEAEDQLLAEAFDHHAHAEVALDAALDDMAALSAELAHSRRRPLLLRSATNLNRIEDLLLEAIVRTHPHRERALDRLLGDLTCCGELENHDEREPADPDTFIDNDFDGLG